MLDPTTGSTYYWNTQTGETSWYVCILFCRPQCQRNDCVRVASFIVFISSFIIILLSLLSLLLRCLSPLSYHIHHYHTIVHHYPFIVVILSCTIVMDYFSLAMLSLLYSFQRVCKLEVCPGHMATFSRRVLCVDSSSSDGGGSSKVGDIQRSFGRVHMGNIPRSLY